MMSASLDSRVVPEWDAELAATRLRAHVAVQGERFGDLVSARAASSRPRGLVP